MHWTRQIKQAMSLIDPVFLHSPQYSSDALSRLAGSDVVLKLKTASPIWSFKGRGRGLALHSAEPDTRPLVCVSAGNFGLGLASAAAKRGRHTEVFAPCDAHPVRIFRMRELGTVVRLTGRDLDEANALRQWLA